MDWLKQAFLESTLVQALIALIMLGVICYLYITQAPVPEPLVNFFALILGYYFGSKTQQTIQRR